MQMLFYRCDISGILFELKESGIEGGWMTSAGPSLVAFTLSEKKLEKAVKIFKRRKCKNITIVRPSNEGIIEVDDFPKK
jgi:predicted sugar kinase